MKKILVTQPSLPDIKDFAKGLDRLWQTKWLTNNGEFAQELEGRLRQFLGVKHAIFVSNGTIAMQLALKALDIKNEVITTPFSYVATTNAIMWEHCKPIFVDIDPETAMIDPKKVEAAITKDTEAILAVHIYGNTCDVEALEKVAKKHNLKLIYDAAHAFGTRHKSKSVLNYGDVSTLSFHATKLFHTVEGGAVITNNDEIAKKIKLLRSFGQDGDGFVVEGINAKNSELHALMGLCNLNLIDKILSKRKLLAEAYDKNLEFARIIKPKFDLRTELNYAYYPVVFKSEKELLAVVKSLEGKNIFPRRYFYPSLNELSYVEKVSCPISESLSRRVICLPLHNALSVGDVKNIAMVINKTLAQFAVKTVSVGISALNEEKSVASTVKAIFAQKLGNFVLDKVIVVSDGSTDETVKNLRSLNFRNLVIVDEKQRMGKSIRLNEISQMCESDILIHFDADLVFRDKDVIRKLITPIENDSSVGMVSGMVRPIEPKSFFEKILYDGTYLWIKTRERATKQGKNTGIYYSAGAIRAFRKSFYKSIKFPAIKSEDIFPYLFAISNSFGFYFASDAEIFYKLPGNFNDYKKQMKRYLSARNEQSVIFDEQLLKQSYTITMVDKIEVLLIELIKNPVFTILYLGLLVTPKVQVLLNRTVVSGSTWEEIKTSKI
ncbi:aminotransferase class I/II-fold pyridoxal phosphate-dependent enzyme [Patescibacteria group bacterium]|nr:aminotransferase class I/II-fold pyridoxal phosphate-dependent enzyme [Patescibacteria group bacterium]